MIEDKVKQQAIESSPNECCGLIIEKDNIKDIIRCKNSFIGETNKYFNISPEDYLKASLAGKIVGLYHSHFEKDYFSIADKTLSEGHKLNLLLYTVLSDSFVTYSPCGWKNPYIGRSFIFKTNDCFSLIKEYFKNELNIDIGNYNYSANWADEKPTIFDENWENGGFEKIHVGQFRDSSFLRPNDLILENYWRNDAHPGHILLYLGGDMILHQPRNDISKMEILTQSMKSRVAYVLRHKELR